MPDRLEFEARIAAFESAWRSESPPEIERFLWPLTQPHVPAAERRRLLVELICLDLEYRWRADAKGTTFPAPTLESYLPRFPELGGLDQLPLELIGEEYRVRHRWGDRPSHAQFLARFAERRDAIEALLREIDRELRDEADESAPEPDNTAPSEVTRESDPRAPLPYSDYLLQKLIGAGRMGKVYRAWQKSLARPVAVKYLRKLYLQQRDAVERFRAEAQTLARLRHPGIVGVHGLGRTPGGGYFIVMDLQDGPDLARLLGTGPVAMDAALDWAIQACDALEHAHQAEIVHCDLKPANLLRNSDGRVCITDFGLARSLGETARWTAEIEGTAAYMAPEQVSRAWGVITPQTDVYGLGAVLYALLTGRAPHAGRRLVDILAAVASPRPVTAPQTIRPEISDKLNRLCLKCLAKSPGERYQSAREVRQGLLEYSLSGCRPDGTP